MELDPLRLALVAVAALGGSLVNSIAGGGTLLTFPALVAIGIPPLTANATSTVSLWPGSLASVWGYRSELTGAGAWSVRFAIPSILGGFVGAWLLLRTPADRFEVIVPWLILGATGLFAAQGTVMRLVNARPPASTPPASTPPASPPPAATAVLPPPPPSILFWQFLVGIYGGYFGAGIGIMMLAALGLMGLTNIHQMNGLKNWGGMCANLTAAATFAVSGIVSWPVAFTMAAAAIVGGYMGARMAQRVSQVVVRRLITAIGVSAGLILLVQQRAG